jgi:signal transduction histidine kinase
VELESEKRRLPFLSWLILAFFALVVVAAGLLYTENFERRRRDDVSRELESIAALKVSELVQWRKERLGDGAVFSEAAYFRELVGRYGAERADPDSKARLTAWMRQVREAYGYDNIFLYDESGKAVLSYPEAGLVDPAIAQAVPATLRAGVIDFLDFYRNGEDGRVYLCVLAPLGKGRGGGVLALRIDPETYFYPFIARWPTQSATAETLLVRRKGDRVVYLTKPRFDSRPPLGLSFPLKGNPELVGAQAASGRTGIFVGRDYRGVPVLAALSAVPGSPWVLFARVDLSEANAGMNERRLLLALLVFALLGSEAAGIVAMIRRQESESLKVRAEASEELSRLNEELESRVARRTSQLEASNEQLEAFAYSVAHDLRTPLRSIDGFASILQEDYEATLGAEGNRVLGVIRSSAQRMDGLISSLLEISRLGRTELRYSRIDMRSMAESAFASVADPETAGGFDFSAGEMPESLADPVLIERVWCNLLGNAIKYSLPSPRHEIAVGGYSEDSMSVYYVKDRGVGFDQRYAGKLFGIFQRLHSEKEFEGSGVGLAIVYRILARHGGKAWAEGRLGEGSTFYFSIPERRAT